MAAAKWQQANSAKKCENGRPSQKKSEADSPEGAKASEKCKKSRTSGDKRKIAKKIGVFFCSLFGHFHWPYIGGHLVFFYHRPSLKFSCAEGLRFGGGGASLRDGDKHFCHLVLILGRRMRAEGLNLGVQRTAPTTSVNCLSCKIPYQSLHLLHATSFCEKHFSSLFLASSHPLHQNCSLYSAALRLGWIFFLALDKGQYQEHQEIPFSESK